MKQKYSVGAHGNAPTLAVVAGVALVVFAGGCGKEEPEAEQPAEAASRTAREMDVMVAESPTFDLYARIDAFLMADKAAEAKAAFEAALVDPAFEPYRRELYTAYLRFMVFSDMIEDAKTSFLNLVRTEPENAMPGFDLIYGYYMREGKTAEAVAWVNRLLEQPLTEAMRRQATEWLCVGLMELRQTDDALAVFKKFMETEDAQASTALMSRLSAMALSSRDFAVSEQVLALAEAGRHRAHTAMVNAILQARMALMLAQEDWDGVNALLPTAIEALPDVPLQMVLGQIGSTARRTKRLDRLEVLAELVMRTVSPEKRGSQQMAAREWLSAAMEQGKEATLVARLDDLMELKLDPHAIFRLLSRYFYVVLDKPELVSPLIGRAQTLSPMLTQDDMRNALNALVLDGSFAVGDYDLALSILEGGMPDREPEWVAMATVKVKAHRALKHGDIDAAVAEFRAFMKIIEEGPDSENVDPVSQIIHTRPMILGFNARRIATLYSETGRSDEAEKAFAEAKAYYEDALKSVKDAESEAYIRSELAEIP